MTSLILLSLVCALALWQQWRRAALEQRLDAVEKEHTLWLLRLEGKRSR